MSNIKTLIKGGYRVFVRSWENDGDYYLDKYIDGLLFDEAQFIVKFANFFTDAQYNDPTKFGNMYDPSEGEKFAVTNALIPFLVENNKILLKLGFTPEKFNPIPINETDLDENSEEWDDYLEKDLIKALNIITHIGGRIHGFSENYLTRVTDKVEVLYIPSDVTAIDVTGEFSV